MVAVSIPPSTLPVVTPVHSTRAASKASVHSSAVMPGLPDSSAVTVKVLPTAGNSSGALTRSSGDVAASAAGANASSSASAKMPAVILFLMLPSSRVTADDLFNGHSNGHTCAMLALL